MFEWKMLLPILVFIAALGPIVDRFLLRGHKGKLHGKLSNFWCKLADTAIPDLPRLMADLKFR